MSTGDVAYFEFERCMTQNRYY